MDPRRLFPLWCMEHSIPGARLHSVVPGRARKLPFVTKPANGFLQVQWERSGFAVPPRRVPSIRIQKETLESTQTAGHIWVTSACLMKKEISIFSIALQTRFGATDNWSRR